MEELIAKRYAKALKEVFEDLESIVALLSVLSEVVSDEEVKRILTSPLLPPEKKAEIIIAALGKNVDQRFVNFIKILAEKNRLHLIPVIAKVLKAELQKIKNMYEGVVETQEKLDTEVLSKLENALEHYTGAEINLLQKICDLDGLHVHVDDLGVEVNFSKKRVKEQLIDFIVKSI